MSAGEVSLKNVKNSAILLVECPDQKGIVAAIANFVLAHEGNILHADQHQAAELGYFYAGWNGT